MPWTRLLTKWQFIRRSLAVSFLKGQSIKEQHSYLAENLVKGIPYHNLCFLFFNITTNLFLSYIVRETGKISNYLYCSSQPFTISLPSSTSTILKCVGAYQQTNYCSYHVSASTTVFVLCIIPLVMLHVF